MARIRGDLLEQIQLTSGLKRAAVYARIKDKANELFVTRDVAALAVAAEFRIAINRYATQDQLNQLKGRSSHAPTAAPAIPTVANKVAVAKKKTVLKKPSNSIFVVHGRDHQIRDAMFTFLRAVGLNPIEWNKAIGMTRKASPHVSDILDAAFNNAQAVVVLLTPDDEAQLRNQFHAKHDPAWEKKLRGQARPNVIFEAGLAFARNERGTVLVEIGDMRPFSDVAGRHTVRLNNSTQSRQQLVTKLSNAGCRPDLDGTDWHTAGDFTLTAARKAKRNKH